MGGRKNVRPIIELLPTKGIRVCWKGEEVFVFFGKPIDDYQQWVYEDYSSDDEPEYGFYDLFVDDLCSVWLSTDPKLPGIGLIQLKTCLWQGHELIGMPYEEFESLFHLIPEHHDENEYSTGGSGPNWRYYDIYYFTEQGFDLWVWRKRIRCIFIYDPICRLEDDELEKVLALRNASLE